ncbi:microfibril-associated glycoprotein 4-like [Branchiostoma floridae x Branchiostoma belcheri]
MFNPMYAFSSADSRMHQPQTDYQARANDNENTPDATYANIPADPPMDQPQTDYQARANDDENTSDATHASIQDDPPIDQPRTDYQARAKDNENTPDATYTAIPDDPPIDPPIDQPQTDHQARANDSENTPDDTHPTRPDGAYPSVCSFLYAHRSFLAAGIAVLLSLFAVGLAPLTFSNKQSANNTDSDKPQDCQDILDNDETTPSGVYMVYPRDNLGGFNVFCDMDTDGGGWTLFQRRQDGSVDFYRGWADYRTGFPSNLNGEFWLGNDNLYRLAVQEVYQLRVDMEDVEGETRYAAYDTFAISPESQNYKLHIGNYSGTAGDSLTYHDGKPFSTKDRDNDESRPCSCAQMRKGAWWYDTCHHSNLNGLYHLGTHESYADGVNWYHWKGNYYSLKRTEMKLRPAP